MYNMNNGETGSSPVHSITVMLWCVARYLSGHVPIVRCTYRKVYRGVYHWFTWDTCELCNTPCHWDVTGAWMAVLQGGVSLSVLRSRATPCCRRRVTCASRSRRWRCRRRRRRCYAGFEGNGRPLPHSLRSLRPTSSSSRSAQVRHGLG